MDKPEVAHSQERWDNLHIRHHRQLDILLDSFAASGNLVALKALAKEVDNRVEQNAAEGMSLERLQTSVAVAVHGIESELTDG